MKILLKIYKLCIPELVYKKCPQHMVYLYPCFNMGVSYNMCVAASATGLDE